MVMLWFLKTLSAAKTLLGSSPLLPRYQQTVRVQLTRIVASHRTALKTPGVIPIRLKSVVSTDEQGRIVARPEASFGIGRNLQSPVNVRSPFRIARSLIWDTEDAKFYQRNPLLV